LQKTCGLPCRCLGTKGEKQLRQILDSIRKHLLLF